MNLRLRWRKWACAILFCFLLGYLATRLVSYEENGGKSEETPVAGGFLASYGWNNESFCNWRYGLPEKLEYNPKVLGGSPETGPQGDYDVLYDAIVGYRRGRSEVKVTYCTHATPEYIAYVVEVLKTWSGPVSLSTFVPNQDLGLLIQNLERICHCLPESSRLSLHLAFPRDHPPILTKKMEETCTLTQVDTSQTFRNTANLPYPVNVCRNSARHAARTPHVLVSDIELIPSFQLGEHFTRFISHKPSSPPRVWVLPVWELEPSAANRLPRTKTDLVQLVGSEEAGYFHRRECAHCQRFPGLMRWLRSSDPGPKIRAFLTTRRHFPFHRWEPVYIGTDLEPLYSELLTWEGRQDKMTQMLEMCLIGYRLVILDGAFLVHWPSKHKNFVVDGEKHRRENSKYYHKIVSDLVRKYPTNDACRP